MDRVQFSGSGKVTVGAFGMGGVGMGGRVRSGCVDGWTGEVGAGEVGMGDPLGTGSDRKSFFFQKKISST